MLILVVISFAIGTYFYPLMPPMMVSHWNNQGIVDGYMTKSWALFLMPIISLAMVGLFLLLPKIDPLKANYSKFRKYYDNFILLIIGFLFYIYCLSIAWNLGVRFDMTLAMVPALAALFYYAGILLENAKSNWFVGVRTPWTLSSEKVWDKTNKLGAKIFKLFGIASFLRILFGGVFLLWLVAALIIASLCLVVYSYLEFKKETEK